MSEITTVKQAEQYAAQHGIALTAADRKRLASIQRETRAELEKSAPAMDSWADKWNQLYPRVLDAIISMGDTILTMAKTIIVNLGIPLVLVLLLVVEHQRVVYGIQLFETDVGLASFAAWALVLLNLVLEFQVHYIEEKENYIQGRESQWSLRIWARNMAYRLGLGDEWTERHLSPAQRYRRLLRLVTFSIVALALAGSMRDVIAGVDGAWYDAMVTIVTESSLLLILTWAGGLLFTAAAVLSAQGLSRYVAIRAVEIVRQMEQRIQEVDDPHAEEVDRAGAQFLVAAVNDRLHRKAEREAQKRAQAEAKARREVELSYMSDEEEDTQPAEPVSANPR